MPAMLQLQLLAIKGAFFVLFATQHKATQRTLPAVVHFRLRHCEFSRCVSPIVQRRGKISRNGSPLLAAIVAARVPRIHGGRRGRARVPGSWDAAAGGRCTGELELEFGIAVGSEAAACLLEQRRVSADVWSRVGGGLDKRAVYYPTHFQRLLAIGLGSSSDTISTGWSVRNLLCQLSAPYCTINSPLKKNKVLTDGFIKRAGETMYLFMLFLLSLYFYFSPLKASFFGG